MHSSLTTLETILLIFIIDNICTILQYIPYNSRLFCVRYLPPNCASITSYTLTGKGLDVTVGRESNSYSLSDLDPYSNCTVTLTSVNSGGYETKITRTHTTRELGECELAFW